MPRVTVKEEDAAPGIVEQKGELKEPFGFVLGPDGESVTIRDRLSRIIVFRKVPGGEKHQITLMIIKAHGKDVADHETTMIGYILAAGLVSINGKPEMPYTSVRDLDFRLQTLGDEGMLVGAMINTKLYKGVTQEEVEAIAKKLQATSN